VKLEDLAKAAAGATLGGVLTWAGQGLTTAGELRALTHAVERMELRLDAMAPLAAPKVAAK